jgi:MoxR-like ATPase
LAENAVANALVKEKGWFITPLINEVGKVIVGQRQLLDQLLVCVLCNGHILIEGVPGLAKTLTVRSLASAIDATFRRVQFTPDLLPADLVGTLIFNPQSGSFTTRKGPVFTNILLADEINRSPAKVQSALLEAMEERQVTIGDTTYPLEQPFMVLATQNPIEQEGTYHLPEAQVDRFMLKVVVGYPTQREERQIMDRMIGEPLPPVQPVVTTADVLAARDALREVRIEDAIREYIVQLVFATREPQHHKLDHLRTLIAYGASPRATIYLAQAARAHAFIDGRGYVIPDDVKDVAMDVLRHRVLVTYEAEAEDVKPEDIVATVLQTVDVP